MTRNFVSYICIALAGTFVLAGAADSALGGPGDPIKGISIAPCKKVPGPGCNAATINGMATDQVPPPGTGYVGGGSGGGVEWYLPGKAINEKSVQFDVSGGNSPVLTPGGDWSVDSHIDVLYEMLLSVNGGPAVLHTGNGTMRIAGTAPGGQEPRVFDMELLELNLTGLLGGVEPFMLRESPTLASTGKTTITQEAGGTYRIDSFFDVFTELSIDGGTTSAQGIGPVPEPSAIWLAVICGLAVSAARRNYQRRR